MEFDKKRETNIFDTSMNNKNQIEIRNKKRKKFTIIIVSYHRWPFKVFILGQTESGHIDNVR